MRYSIKYFNCLGGHMLAAHRVIKPAGVSRRNYVPVYASKLPLSSPAVNAMKHGRREAARLGSMFLEPTHILLGLLQTECSVAKCLATKFKLDYETVKAAVEESVMVPVASSLQEFDVDMSPRTRTTLIVAQECAREQGSPVLGTAHLAGALVQDTHSILNGLLQVMQVPIMQVEESLLSLWQEQPEGLAVCDSQTPEQQVERLQQEYTKMQQAGVQPPLQRKAEEAANDVYE